MKFNVSKNALYSELAHLVRVTEKKSTTPILQMVLIETEEDSIRLSATDLDVGLVTTCKAEVSEPGCVVLSAKKLFDIVKNLPDAEISFQREVKKKSDPGLTMISCAGSQFKMATQDKEHFPNIAKAPESSTGFSVVILQALVERTVYAITMEESRYALSGALFECNEKTLRMVATDGHRLALAESPCGLGKHKMIVPRKALNEIAVLSAARTKESKDGEVLFSRDENHTFFQFGHRLLISRMLDGQFPNYDLVIPKKHDNVVSLATKDLAQALTRMALMADVQSHGVKLKLEKDSLVISAQTADVGEGREVITVDYKGEPVEIGFNAKYCLEFLNTANADRIDFSLNNGESPALFRPEGDEGYSYVVMPMRLT